MTPFTTITAVAAPLATNDVDTDVIYPGRFLSTIKRMGLGPLLFHGLRYDTEGEEVPGFVLNRPPYREAGILVTGQNFGCGSSREHAPWALLDFGIRCIIAPSFADIFAGNCVKNGILLVTLDEATMATLMEDADQGERLTVDLESQTITRPAGEIIPFEVAPEARETLLAGTDEISETMSQIGAIRSFEEAHRQRCPWL